MNSIANELRALSERIRKIERYPGPERLGDFMRADIVENYVEQLSALADRLGKSATSGEPDALALLDAARWRKVRAHYEVSAARGGFHDLLSMRGVPQLETSAETMDRFADAISNPGPTDRGLVALVPSQSTTKEGWQPIETAPRDNTRIIIWHEGIGDVCVAWWTGSSFWCQGSLGHGGLNRTYPNHWLTKLPTPPEKTS